MAKTYRKLQVFTPSADFKAATKVVEAPLTEPAAGEIRVKQIYAGCNATDINISAARYFTDGKVPFDVGLEALGVVDAIGSGVPADKFKIGQPALVFGSGTGLTGFAEYSYKPPESVIPVPELKPEYLVSLVNGLTATLALDKQGRVQPGEKVLVTAAAGGTGQIVVQWAKHRGAHVVALTSSAEKAKHLKELGADEIINYREVNLDKVLSEKYPDGVDIIWETIGGETFKTLFNHLAIGGRLVVIGGISGYKGEGFEDIHIPQLNAQLLRGSKTLTGFLLGAFVKYVPEYLPQLIGGIAKGTIKAQVDLGEKSPEGRFFGVDQVYRAEEWLHSGKNLGKVVVQLQNV